MGQRLLLIKIVGCLVVVALAVGASIGVTLYHAAVNKTEAVLTDMARTISAQIESMAKFDLKYNVDESTSGGFGATLAQVRDAFGGLQGNSSVHEIHFLQGHGKNITILVTQTARKDKASPTNVDANSDYGKVLNRGLSGETGVAHAAHFDGQPIIVAYAPVPSMHAAVAVETDLSNVSEPFIRAALFGLIVGGSVIGIGAAFTFAQTGQVIRSVVEASQNLKLARSVSEKTHAQLEAALKATNDGFALFDADDRLVIFNQVYRDDYERTGTPLVLGLTFEEMVRARTSAGAYVDDGDDMEARVQRRLERHRNPTGPFERAMSDGRWLLISERRTGDGGTVVTWTDVTELKRKEKELLDSRQRFRDFTETASDWVWETDRNHRFVLVMTGPDNPYARDFATAIGLTRWEVAREDTTTERWQRHREDMANHRPFRDFQYRFADAAGGIRHAAVSGLPVFDDAGRFSGYRGTATDVTAIHQQREEILLAEKRFRAAFENVTVGIVLADETGQVLAFNQAASKIFGYEAAEVIGRNVRTLMPEPDRGRHDGYMQNYLTTGEAKIIGHGREVTALRKNGETFPAILGIAEMPVEGRRQFIASISDISAERNLETQLRQAQRMESVGQMVGGIAHDFNNLLGIIIGNLDLAKRKIDGDSPLFRQVDKAVSAANRGAALTRRLLNFSRTAPITREAVDVNAAIRNVQDMIQRSITKNIDVRLVLADPLPPVVGDPGDLDDSLVNLAVNARDAMPDGGVLRIETRLITLDGREPAPVADLAPGDYVEIDVTDTGSGIPKDVLPRIFDPFFSTKEKGKGTGLGLSMVYGFARRSNGRVTVYSEEGIGTTFKLFLPAVVQGTAAAETGNCKPGDPIPHGTERVLVVDDEADLAEVAAAFLGDLGYTVLIAHSGPEAMTILESQEPVDLLLSDVIMPGGMTGFDLAEEAKRLRPNLRICLASGFTGEMVGAKDGRAARYPLLRKPYSNHDLAGQVRRLLDYVAGPETA